MKTVTIFFNNGTMKKFKVNGMNFYKELVLDVELFVDGETIAEFNSEHIAGYTIEDCPTQTEFQRKADASFAEGCYLDQGITQCFCWRYRMRHDEFPIIDKFVHQEINRVLEEIKAEINDLRDSHLINFVYGERIVDVCIEIIDKHIGKEGGTE